MTRGKPLEGTLEGFRDWCMGHGRGGPLAGMHRSALDAVDRYQKYLHHIKREGRKALESRQQPTEV